MRSLSILLIAICFTTGSADSHVAIDFPQGAEMFKSGEIVTIRWHIAVPHNLENWDLFYSTDGAHTWTLVAGDIPGSQLEYAWTVPEIATTQGQIKVVMDNSEVDYEAICLAFTVSSDITSAENLQQEEKFVLFYTYPNPLAELNFYSFLLSGREHVSLELFSISGIKQLTILNQELTSGFYTGSWEAAKLPAGTYILCIRITEKVENRVVFLFR